MSKSLKILFAISLLLNIIGLYIGAEKIYISLNRTKFNDILYYALDRRSIYDMFPIKQNQIVFAGDSHMQYYDTEEYLPGYNIVNRGIAGDFTAGLIERINPILMSHPKILVMEIGFNDLWRGVSVDSVLNNYTIIINNAKKISPYTKLLFISVMPSDIIIRDVRVKSLIPILNENLDKLCKTNNIAFINLYSAFSDNGALKKSFGCGDGVHLSGTGYSALTIAIKPYLN